MSVVIELIVGVRSSQNALWNYLKQLKGIPQQGSILVSIQIPGIENKPMESCYDIDTDALNNDTWIQREDP